MSDSESMPKPPTMHPRMDDGDAPVRVRSPQQGLSWITWILLAALGVVVAWVIWQERSDAVTSAVQWRTDYATALTEAKKANKPVLLNFTTEWNKACHQMKRDVWTDSSIADLVHARTVPVLMDLDRPVVRQIADKLGVMAYPTVLLVDPQGIEFRRAGPMSRDEVREFLGMQ